MYNTPRRLLLAAALSFEIEMVFFACGHVWRYLNFKDQRWLKKISNRRKCLAWQGLLDIISSRLIS
jgi:hypothetical protein